MEFSKTSFPFLFQPDTVFGNRYNSSIFLKNNYKVEMISKPEFGEMEDPLFHVILKYSQINRRML